VSNEVATLIGDVLHSREVIDRSGLHARLTRTLALVNDTYAPTTPLRVQLGDEYQGTFATVEQAARAALRLRVALLPEHDVRQGLSWGEVRVLQSDPRVEDGPGWWAARDAVHALEEAEARPATSRRRTAYRDAGPGRTGLEAWLESFLVLRDEIVGGLSPRSLSVLRGLLDGRTQRDIAGDLGISASAVSQRVRSDGLGGLLIAEEMLKGAT